MTAKYVTLTRDGEEWAVVELVGPKAAECAQEAITMARMTGSIGATVERTSTSSLEDDSTATVERLVHSPYCGCATCSPPRCTCSPTSYLAGCPTHDTDAHLFGTEA